ncbi:MAG TPA: XdhC/CoxI family protein [Polyangiaceae bacterium]|nr:XdhC/CoxI family protein [Polyangiaceae bacterium]
MQAPSSPSDPLAALAELRARGVPFVMATVVRAVSPTSAKPGDKAVLTHGGVLAGWIGGSCAEPLVRREAEAALRDGECRLLHITPEAEGPADRPGLSVHKMECYSGGALEIYIEPFLPMPALLVFGNSPVARALCDLGRVMGYRVTAVDLGDRPPMGADLDVVRDLDDLPAVDPSSTFAVVASHGVFDEESLDKALSLDLAYTGLVASAKRRDQVFAALRARGVAADRVARVSAPAGLELGARQPQEIALAVMAQIVSVRRAAPSVAEGAIKSLAGSGAPRSLAASTAPAAHAPERRLAVAPAAAPAAQSVQSVHSCCHERAAHDPE